MLMFILCPMLLLSQRVFHIEAAEGGAEFKGEPDYQVNEANEVKGPPTQFVSRRDAISPMNLLSPHDYSVRLDDNFLALLMGEEKSDSLTAILPSLLEQIRSARSATCEPIGVLNMKVKEYDLQNDFNAAMYPEASAIPDFAVANNHAQRRRVDMMIDRKVKAAVDKLNRPGEFNFAFSTMSFAVLGYLSKAAYYSSSLLLSSLSGTEMVVPKRWPALKEFVPELNKKLFGEMKGKKLSGILLLDTAGDVDGAEFKVEDVYVGCKSLVYNIVCNNFQPEILAAIYKGKGLNTTSEQRRFMLSNWVDIHYEYSLRQRLQLSGLPRTRVKTMHTMSLGDVLIPGTHDTAAYKFKDKKQVDNGTLLTQSWSLNTQLKNGIRFFDIRLVKNNDGKLWTAHAATLLEPSFVNVITTFAEHMEQKQKHGAKDFILFSIKPEATNPLKLKFWNIPFKELYNLVQQEICSMDKKYARYFARATDMKYKNIQDIPMSDLYGKITLVLNDFDGGLKEGESVVREVKTGMSEDAMMARIPIQHHSPGLLGGTSGKTGLALKCQSLVSNEIIYIFNWLGPIWSGVTESGDRISFRKEDLMVIDVIPAPETKGIKLMKENKLALPQLSRKQFKRTTNRLHSLPDHYTSKLRRMVQSARLRLSLPAATKIQAIERGHQARKRIAAATKIQAIERGRQARKRFAGERVALERAVLDRRIARERAAKDLLERDMKEEGYGGGVYTPFGRTLFGNLFGLYHEKDYSDDDDYY